MGSSLEDFDPTKCHPLEFDRLLFVNNTTSRLPYDPHLDPAPANVFTTGMPGVHSREMIINSEGFWAKFIYVREDGELKKYLDSNAVKSPMYREEVREMVAMLGHLIFETLIWIS